MLAPSDTESYGGREAARGYVMRAFPAQYAVSRDDRRFLMIRPLPIAPDELVVVEDWFQELQSKRRN